VARSKRSQLESLVADDDAAVRLAAAQAVEQLSTNDESAIPVRGEQTVEP
jgi:hypothetical protein